MSDISLTPEEIASFADNAVRFAHKLDPTSEEGQKFSAFLVSDDNKIPFASFHWARRHFQKKDLDSNKAEIFLQAAFQKVQFDNKPGGFVVRIAKLLIKYNRFNQAETILETSIKASDNGHFTIENVPYFYTALASSYKKQKEYSRIVTLLETMPEHIKNSVTYNTHGNALIHDGRPSDAVKLFEAMPEPLKNSVTYNTHGNALIHDGRPSEAVKLLDTMPECMKDAVTYTTYGDALILDERASEAVTLLENMPERMKDAVTYNTHANALIHDERANEAVILFENMPECMKDAVTYATHGNALFHAFARSEAQRDQALYRQKFETLYDDQPKSIYLDYIAAKFAYFNNDSKKMQSLLQPYIADPECADTIISLFMASYDPKSPVIAMLGTTINDSERFDYLRERANEFRENPLRTELDNSFISHGHSLFELGGTPTGRQAAAGAGVPIWMRPPQHQ